MLDFRSDHTGICKHNCVTENSAAISLDSCEMYFAYYFDKHDFFRIS